MYRPISDYAIIGDTQTAALISSSGSIDWLCLPYFDSDAVFLRLLDEGRGGYCAVEPENVLAATRRYLEATNILETRFETRSGLLIVTDFMPVRTQPPTVSGQDVATEHRTIRLIRCEAGTVRFTVAVRPTFSFAREVPAIERTDAGGLLFRGRRDALAVHCACPLSERGGEARADVQLTQGESVPLVLTYAAPAAAVAPLGRDDVQTALDDTTAYWRDWSRGCTYDGPYREAVARSALTLKLLTFEPTGAIIAAPTTSLPEEIGGVRNWDYRFTWLRDSAFLLRALMNLGYFGEARDFLRFLCRACECPASEFQILYDIHGGPGRPEETLAHLDGYRGSRPVRVGNAAARQKQLDVYGELLDCISLYARGGVQGDALDRFLTETWPTIATVADYVSRHWLDPDSGIWEVRSGVRHFVHSKAMCWVALDRALRLATLRRVHGNDVVSWERERDAIFRSLLRDGFNGRVGAFVQSYESTALDAAVLRLPMLGVIAATDPLMRSTVERIERSLVRNGLVYRYLDGDDGLAGGEATFAICTFWLINNYVMQGRLSEAERVFHHVLSHANDVGLFAEEIEPVSGEQLGNFPQGFTHIALINAAVRLAAALQGRVPVVNATSGTDNALPGDGS